MPVAEAMYYEKLDEQKVRCFLCPHHCLIQPGKAGLCRVRANEGGRLQSLNYGEVASLALDPIEKKPLYHFCPGTMILSAGTFGCNLSCGFCQNYSLAHGRPATQYIDPGTLAEIALLSTRDGSVGMAFTYNEPG
ncbi:MAG: AmmeMemoRadiSam system radical SAM enzyme, partial [Syntrophomonas sp.]